MSRSVPSLVGRLLKLDHHTLRDTTSFTRKGQINPEDREAGIELASRLIELRGQPIARVTSRLMEQVEDVTLVVAK